MLVVTTSSSGLRHICISGPGTLCCRAVQAQKGVTSSISYLSHFHINISQGRRRRRRRRRRSVLVNKILVSAAKRPTSTAAAADKWRRSCVVSITFIFTPPVSHTRSGSRSRHYMINVTQRNVRQPPPFRHTHSHTHTHTHTHTAPQPEADPLTSLQYTLIKIQISLDVCLCQNPTASVTS